MNVTDELRKMLDERGVEWEDMSIFPLTCTSWLDHDGEPCTALEGTDDIPDGKLSVQSILTTAQAIAATLGVETCHLEEIDKGCDTASEYMINREWCFDAVYRCSCGCRFGHAAHDRPRFCPNCGAKVVEE